MHNQRLNLESSVIVNTMKILTLFIDFIVIILIIVIQYVMVWNFYDLPFLVASGTGN